MAKEIRNYKSINEIEELLERYYEENESKVIANLVDRTSFNSFDELKLAENNCYFDFDCGFIYLVPNDENMLREWRLDNGKWCRGLLVDTPFYFQSTTLNKELVEIALEDLKLTKDFWIKVVLD